MNIFDNSSSKENQSNYNNQKEFCNKDKNVEEEQANIEDGQKMKK